MSNEINLLSKITSARVPKERKTAKKLLRISLICLSLAVVLSLALFVITFQSANSTGKKQEATALEDLASKKQEALKYLFTKERLSQIAPLLEKRGKVAPHAFDLKAKIPQDVIIESLNLDEKSASLTISSSGLLAINSFIDAFSFQSANNTLYKSVALDGITLDDSKHRYTMSLKINFNE